MKINNSKEQQPQNANVVRVQPHEIEQPKDWKRGLNSCCNVGISMPICKSFFCPCVMFGELAHQTGYGDCFLCGVAYCVFAPMWVGVDLSCLVHRGLRKHIRQIKGLPQKPCNDVYVTWFCGCCALAQEYFEMNPES